MTDINQQEAQKLAELTINDLLVRLPVEKIKISQDYKSQEALPLRSGSSFIVSGFGSSIKVSLPIIGQFGTESSADIVKLYNYIRRMPFVFIKSQYLYDYLEKGVEGLLNLKADTVEKIAAESNFDKEKIVGILSYEDRQKRAYNIIKERIFGKSQYMVFAVHNMNLSTVPGTSDGVRLTLDMEFSLYTPYVRDLKFRKKAFDPEKFKKFEEDWNNVHETWHMNNLTKEDYIIHRYRIDKDNLNQVTEDISESQVFEYLYGGSVDNQVEIDDKGQLITEPTSILTAIPNSDVEFQIVQSGGMEDIETTLGSIKLPDTATTFIAINHAFQFASMVLQGMPYPTHQYLGLGQSSCMIGFVSRGTADSNTLNSVVNFYNVYQAMCPKVQEKISLGEPRLTLPKIYVFNEFLNQMGIRQIVFNGQVKETIQGTSDGEQFVITFIDANKNKPDNFVPKRNRFTSENKVYLNTIRKLYADKLDKLKGKHITFNLDLGKVIDSISSLTGQIKNPEEVLLFYGISDKPPLRQMTQEGFESVDKIEGWSFDFITNFLGWAGKDTIQNEKVDITYIDPAEVTMGDATLKEMFDTCLKAASSALSDGIKNDKIDAFVQSFIMATGGAFTEPTIKHYNGQVNFTKVANPKNIANYARYLDKALDAKSEFKTEIMPVMIAFKMIEILIGHQVKNENKTQFYFGVESIVAAPTKSQGYITVGGVSLSKELQDKITKAAQGAGIDPNLLIAQVRQESKFNPKAVSYAGAGGLVQLMPATARENGLKIPDTAYKADAARIQHWGVKDRDKTKDELILQAIKDSTKANMDPGADERFDPDKNLNAAATYLAKLIKQQGSDEIGLALAAYNAGPGNKSVRAGQIPQNGETNVYVANILKFKAELERQQAGFYSPKVILDTHLTAIAYDMIPALIGEAVNLGVLDPTDSKEIDTLIHESKVHGGYSYGDFVSRVHPYSEAVFKGTGVPDRLYMNPDEFIFSDAEMNFFTETQSTASNNSDPELTGTSDDTLGLPLDLFKQLQNMNANAISGYNYRSSPEFVNTKMFLDRKVNGEADMVPRAEAQPSTIQPRLEPTVTPTSVITTPIAAHNNANSRKVVNTALGDIAEHYPENDIEPNLANRKGDGYHRTFDANDLAEDVKISSTKNYIKDNPGFRKALPTFKIFFVEEDSMETDYKVLDDFYDINGILEISIIEEKDNPIQTAFIQIVNPSQKILTANNLEDGHYALDTQQQLEKFELNTPYQATDETSMEERFADYFPLKENTKIIIYMGYDQDANKMTKKFVGFVSQIDGGEILNLTCHSYGAELAIDRSTEDREVDKNSDEPYGTTVARSILSQPNILHFGRWQINDYENFKTDSREKIRAAIDGEREFIIKLLEGSIFSAFTDPKLIRRALTTWGYLRSANYDENIFIPYKKEIEDNISKISLPNAHSWRVIKEIEMKYPGIIVYPLPYENRMTMYVGPANGKYSYRDYNMAELMYVADKNKKKIKVLDDLVNVFLADNQYSISDEVTYNGSAQMSRGQLEGQLLAPRVQEINNQTPSVKLTADEVRSIMLVPGSVDPSAPYTGAALDFLPGVDWTTKQLRSEWFDNVLELSYELEELQVNYFGYITNLIELKAGQKTTEAPLNGAAITLSFADRYAQFKNVFMGINNGDEQRAKLSASVFMLILLLLDDQFVVESPGATNGGVSDKIDNSILNFMKSKGAQSSYIDRFSAYVGDRRGTVNDSFFFYDDQLDRLGYLWQSGGFTLNQAAGRMYYNLNRIMNMAVLGEKAKDIRFKNQLNRFESSDSDYTFSGPFPDYMDRLKIFNDAVQNLMKTDLSNTRVYAYFVKLLAVIAAPQANTVRQSGSLEEFNQDAADKRTGVDPLVQAAGAIVGAGAAYAAVPGVVVPVADAIYGITAQWLAASLISGGSVALLTAILFNGGATIYEIVVDNNEGIADIFGNFDDELKNYIVGWITISALLDQDTPFQTTLASSNLLVNTRYKMFRQYHSAASARNIIYNGIKYTEKNVFNAISVPYDAVVGTNNKVLKFDESLPDWKLRIYPYSTATEINNEAEATRYASALLEKNINRGYDGQLILMGNPEIKPYDYIYINDTYRSMFGFVEVRAVTHTLNRQGFITEVIPGLCTSFYDIVNPSLLASVAFNIANLFDSEATGFEMDNDYKRLPNPKGLSDEELKKQYDIDLKKELARSLTWSQAVQGGAWFSGATAVTTGLISYSTSAALGSAVLGSFGTFFLAATLGVTLWYGACAFFFPEDDNRIPVSVHPLLQNNQPFIGEGFNPKSISSMAAFKHRMVERAIGMEYLAQGIVSLPETITTNVKLAIVKAILKN